MLAAMSYPLPQEAGQFCSAVPSRSCSKTEGAAKEDNTPQQSAQNIPTAHNGMQKNKEQFKLANFTHLILKLKKGRKSVAIEGMLFHDT